MKTKTTKVQRKKAQINWDRIKLAAILVAPQLGGLGSLLSEPLQRRKLAKQALEFADAIIEEATHPAPPPAPLPPPPESVAT